MQAWHQDSIQCHMLDFRGKGELQRKENFIEWIKGSTLLRSSLINRNNVRTPIQFRKRKAIPESWNIFLSRANLSVFISITPVIWMVKWSKLSIPSIEINKPLPTLALSHMSDKSYAKYISWVSFKIRSQLSLLPHMRNLYIFRLE